MKIFGNKEEFAIQYQYFINVYHDEPDVIANPEQYEMDGWIYFWVKGKNIFAFDGFEPEATYGADLNILIEYFCNNLHYLLVDDPFPKESISTNAIDMMEETKLVEGEDNDITKYLDVDWDKVDMELSEKITVWNYHHGLLTNGGGTFIPDSYFRKVNNTIEISWKTNYSYKNQEGMIFYFKHKQGVEYVDIKLFKNTIVEFCLDFINKFKDKYPERMKVDMVNLQKAIEIEV
jgi:hypothetical protein